MSGPVRWRDDAAARQEVRELLRGGRLSRPMPKEARARTGARLDRLVVAPAAAGLLFWIKGVAVAGLGVAGVVAAVRAVPALEGDDRADVRSPPPRVLPPPISTRSAPPDMELVPTPSENATPTPTSPSLPPKAAAPLERDRTTPARASSPLEPAPRDPLEREAAMLEDARAVLDSNPRVALAALDRYAASFPAGQLRMEGELLAVHALQRLGRLDEARTRGSVLLAEARGSIYEERVKAMLNAIVSP